MKKVITYKGLKKDNKEYEDAKDNQYKIKGSKE